MHRIQTNGITLAVHLAGPPAGAPVVLLHGFPELAHSWRHQIACLASAGYRIIAPDLRGYGETGPQGDLADYRMDNLARDVLGLLDALGVPRATVVGHDFGGMLTWTLARDHPARVRGVVSLCTPYTRRTDVDLAETMRRTKGSDNYMVAFQSPGPGEALLSQNVDALFRHLMRRPPEGRGLDAFAALPASVRCLPMESFLGIPGWMGDAFLGETDLAVYVNAFRRTSFTGALNWYRNLPRNWQDTAGRSDRVEVPALMLCAACDHFLPPATTRGMEAIVPDLERHTLPGCGHWMQQEQPEEVNRLLLDWLGRRMQANES